MRKPDRLAAAIAATLILAACSMAPSYHAPTVPVAAQYQSNLPWTAAQPADQLPRDQWWTLYGDPRLDQLEGQLLTNNATLAASWASYQQSRAYLSQVRADLYPQVSLSGNAQRDRESDTRPLRGATSPAWYNSYTAGGEADYEVDLWGRVRDSVAAGSAQAQAAQADLASVRLSLQTELADSYVVLLGLDRQIKLLGQNVDAYQRALQLTQALHSGGIVAGLDVSRAQTQLSSARSLLSQTQAQRALIVHAIAVLVGQSASEFNLAEQTQLPTLPAIPLGLPSTLLQRRPDIAAAERRTAAANAQIGVARSAFFPSLDLNAQGGYQSTMYSGLLSSPNLFWAIGPSLFLDVFDGGRRKAQVAQAKAATDEAGARYRGVVLAAFQQVEDNQSLLADLGHALIDQQAAADAAQRTLTLAMEQYKQGAVSYLDVVTAQTAALQAQLSLLDLQTRQLRASVQLVRALGGGWSSDQLAAKQQLGAKAMSTKATP